ncbi:MAG: hypothetical protein H6664_07115 [Ardenticatenaceae bacterium]|nr:hypothetical protein [Ardenticatenaceae bacterium]MCB9004128.1 hypothetical protein [Ardenticatenaceae bacterium]
MKNNKAVTKQLIRLSGFLLAALLVLLAADHAHAWTTVASMGIGRNDHTATLLSDGRILVVGGSSGYTVREATAELYDPVTNSWSYADSMSTPRTGHTATLLPDGRVLVAGGRNGGSSFTSAELYDPISDTWSAAASMTNGRIYHTATLLPDGRVLVTGGIPGAAGVGYQTSAELYDPISDSWSAAADMTVARYVHTATLLSDGRVLIVAGYGPGGYQTSVELYDPTSDSWSAAASLTVSRYNHTATLLPNGNVLVVGGYGGSFGAYLTSVELYDPVADSWSNAAYLATARMQHTATLLPDGRLLVAGGFNQTNGRLRSVEVYDPIANSWSAATDMALTRSGHAAALLADGRVLIMGSSGTSPSASAEVYDSAVSSWNATGAMTDGRFVPTATLLSDGRVLVVGGNGSGGYFNSAELYNPATGNWSAADSLTDARYYHIAVLLPDGRVLIAGGQNSVDYLASVELYDPATNSWSAATSMNAAHSASAATLLADGRVLVVGGWNGTTLGSAELYDPATNIWSYTATDMATPRSAHTATLLPDGRVLVVGGWNGTMPVGSAELYDPATNSWSSAGSIATGRYDHTATLLPDGRVLIAGGYGSDYLTSAELYNPADNSWSLAGSMTNGRMSHTATLLPNGRVLATGGMGTGDSYLANTERYDPTTDVWSDAGNMANGRQYHRAALLADGRVLVVGGLSGSGVFANSADLYERDLGFDDAWRPVISDVGNPLPLGGALTLTGSQLRGISEAAGGSTNDSSSGYPLVQLRSLVNEQLVWLQPASGLGWSDIHFTSTAVTNFPAGPALVTVFSNGIPSKSAVIQVGSGVVWDNDSGDGLWSTASNWSGNTVPDSMDTVVFNATSTADALVDAAFSGTVNGVVMDTGYNGTISMGRSLAATSGLVVRDGVLQVSDTHSLTTGSVQHTGGVMAQTQAVGVGSAAFLQIEDGHGNVRYHGAEIDTSGTGTDVGNATVRVQALAVGAYCTADGAASPLYARRCFEITVDGTNGPADLTLYAPASALGNVANNALRTIAQSDLALYRYTSSPWTELAGANGSSDGFAFATGQTPGFSHFLLAETGGGGAPTAVTLQSLTTNSSTAVLPILLTFILLALGTGMVIVRRRS